MYFDYCFGFGFILLYDVVVMFVEVFDVVLNFRIDDVYIGIFVYKIGIKVMYNDGFVFLCLLNIVFVDMLVRYGILEYCGDSLMIKIQNVGDSILSKLCKYDFENKQFVVCDV